MAGRGIFFEGGAIWSARRENLDSKFSGTDAQRARSDSIGDAAPLVINNRPRPLSAASCIRPEHQRDLDDVRAQLRTRPRSAVDLGGGRTMMRSPSTGSGMEEKHALLKEMTTPKRAMGVKAGGCLGYKSGLTRSSSMAESRFPRYVSDIHTVIENIKALEKIELAAIAAEEAHKKEFWAAKSSVEISKTKDLCVLKFPKQGGTRLMVKRWSKGFVIHPPRNAGPPMKPRVDTLDSIHLLSYKVAQAEKKAAERAAEEEKARALAELVQDEMHGPADGESQEDITFIGSD